MADPVISCCLGRLALQAAVIVGSQARTKRLADEWSDLDVIIVTREPEKYIERLAILSGDKGMDMWHTGRFLEEWADPGIVERLRGSFADNDKEAVRSALCRQMELHHDIASQVAARRALPYPADEVETIRARILKTGSAETNTVDTAPPGT